MPENRRKVLITGATGFTGEFVVKKFLNDPGFDVAIFVRDVNKASRLGFTNENVKICEGSFEEENSLLNACNGKDTLINIASLGFGHGAIILKACNEAGIRNAIFISTTSVFTKLNPSSKKVRFASEKLIFESSLNYVIIRPTMIFGTKNDRNICRLIKFIKKYPILPIAGPGTSLIQPVFVKDLAEVIYYIARNKLFTGKAYNISGERPYSFNELVDIISQILNKNIIKLHIPLGLMKFVFKVYESVSPNPIIKVEQLVRLNEDKSFSHEEARAAFNYYPHNLIGIIKKEVGDIFAKEA